MKRLIASATWAAEVVHDALRAYVVEHLGEVDGVLGIDETGFLMTGDTSADVQRQCSSTAGRIGIARSATFSPMPATAATNSARSPSWPA